MGSEITAQLPRADSPVAQIHRLPDALVDQIAAGEVVERPASVVKELVENALDANASRVQVEVRDGGNAWIAVTDDGDGMSKEDARLALTRHATSKLRSADDLQRIVSFGFRGEAVPAIASVSRFRLLTRARGAPEAFEIRVDGGRLIDERTAGGPEGTRIEVADLFASVPARRKFLKKASTEWGHIADWLGRLALALPGVHFDVRRDDRQALVWPAVGDPLDRIAAVLSDSEAAALCAVEHESPAGHLQAFLSTPEATRGNGNGIYLFVNGRPVRDRMLRHALLQSYRDLLPRGRFPSAVVFLTLPPDRVDVNVHPAKWEVRFAEPQAVHQLLRRAVRDAMASRHWLGGATGLAPRATVSESEWRAISPRAPGESTAGFPTAGPDQTHDWIRDEASAETLATGSTVAAAEDGGRLLFSDMALVGQMRASYLLVEGPLGLVIVDQHAAHERVLYERLRSQWLEEGVERQGLLIPATVDLDPAAMAAFVGASETAGRLGFDVEAFGEDSVVVRAVPALLAGFDPAELVRGLIGELEKSGEDREESVDDTRLLLAADRVFATLACHGARRFGDHLPPEEQRAILDGLDAIPWAPTCPHGRPVAISLDVPEIERRFGRR